MENHEERIHLYGTDTYITETAKDAFRVASGSVLVFIAPLKKGSPDIRRMVCEVTEGHLIPSFAYRDENYVNWRFLFTTRDEAELIRLPGMATSVLYRRFAEAAGVEGYKEEGFEKSLIEHYQRESLKDNIFINLGDKQGSGILPIMALSNRHLILKKCELRAIILSIALWHLHAGIVRLS